MQKKKKVWPAPCSGAISFQITTVLNVVERNKLYQLSIKSVKDPQDLEQIIQLQQVHYGLLILIVSFPERGSWGTIFC